MITRMIAMAKLRSAAAAAGTPFLRKFLGGTSVALAAFAVYANTLGNGFVLDDKILITENSFVQDWRNIGTVLSWDFVFPETVPRIENAARPAWIVSALIDCKWWGLFPAGHHLTSVALHSLNSLLVFAAGGLLAGLPAGLAAGLLFAVHPVHTEAVASVGFRADLLAAFFFLGAFLLYKLMERVPGRRVRAVAGRLGLLGGSVAAYGMGLLSKEMAITLPLVLVLHDYFLSCRRDLPALARRAPVHLAYLSLWPLYFVFHGLRSDYSLIDTLERLLSKLTLAAQAQAYPVASPTPSISELLRADPLVNISTMAGVFAQYVKLLVWPFALRSEYAVSPLTPGHAAFWLAAAVLAGVLAGAAALARRQPLAAWGILAFFAALLPVSNIQPIFNVMAERYLYLPSVFFCLAAGYGAALAWERSRGPARAPLGAAFAAVLCVFAAAAVDRNAVWRDERTFWETAARQTPESPRAWYNLGVLAQKAARYDEARELYRKTLLIRPDHVEARTNLALLDESVEPVSSGKKARTPIPLMNKANGLMAKGKYDEAIAVYSLIEQDFRRHEYSEAALFGNLAKCYALGGNPALSEGYFARLFGEDEAEAKTRLELGKAFQDRGQPAEAEKQYLEALSLRPGWWEALVDLGVAYHQQGRLGEAVRTLQAGLEKKPTRAAAWYNLGTVYNDMSELASAEKALRQAIRLDPDYADAHYNLGVVLQRQGRLDEAAKSYEAVLRVSPKRVEAVNNLGGCREWLGDLAAAEKLYRRAIELDPARSAPHVNLGNILAGRGELAPAMALYQTAIKVDPWDVMPYHKLGLCYLQLGDLDKAEREFAGAVKVGPRFADAHFYLGVVLSRKGRLPEAVSAWQAALRADPRHAGAMRALEQAGAGKFK